jgi:hypothetical protein
MIEERGELPERHDRPLLQFFVSAAQPLVKVPAFTARATTQSPHVRFDNS